MAWVLWTGTTLPGYSGQPPTVAAIAPFNTTAIVAQGTMFAIVIQVGCGSPMYPMRCVQTPGGLMTVSRPAGVSCRTGASLSTLVGCGCKAVCCLSPTPGTTSQL